MEWRGFRRRAVALLSLPRTFSWLVKLSVHYVAANVQSFLPYCFRKLIACGFPANSLATICREYPGNCSHSSKQYTQCPYLEKYRILFTVYKKRVHFSPKSNKCSLKKMQKLRKVKMKTKINNYMHPLQGSTINTYLCSVLSFLMKLFYIMDIFFNTAIITCYLPFNFLLNHRYFDIITLMYNINFT